MKRFHNLALIAVCLLFGMGSRASAEQLVAVTGTSTGFQALTFDSATPGVISRSVNITGLAAGDSIIGIDRRPANGLIYAVTRNSSSIGRIYVVDPTTGAATLVSTMSVPLGLDLSGVDFNPAADRLRIITSSVLVPSSNQNLRVDVDTGATIIDSPISSTTAVISGSAHSNNFSGATSTALYGIDTRTGSLVIQNSPNEGTITTVGPLGTFIVRGQGATFDISGLTGTAYFTRTLSPLTPPLITFSELFSVNLATGAATSIGRIGPGSVDVVVIGLAAPVGTPVPEPATMLLLGTGLAGVAARVRRRRKSN